MKTRLIPLIVAICVGASLITFAAPPPKKPKPGVTVVVPVPVVPIVVVPVKPPIVVVPAKPPIVVVPPRPAGPVARFCGVERPHAAHQFRNRGVLHHCPGKVAARAPIRR